MQTQTTVATVAAGKGFMANLIATCNAAQGYAVDHVAHDIQSLLYFYDWGIGTEHLTESYKLCVLRTRGMMTKVSQGKPRLTEKGYATLSEVRQDANADAE